MTSAGGLHGRAMGSYKPGEQQYSEMIFRVEVMAYEGRPAHQLESCGSQVCKGCMII